MVVWSMVCIKTGLKIFEGGVLVEGHGPSRLVAPELHACFSNVRIKSSLFA